MKALFVLITLSFAALGEDARTHQAGTNIPVGQWTQIPSMDGFYDPLNPFIPGWDVVGYVPVYDCALAWVNYRTSSGEANKTLICYSFTEHYLHIVDDSGAFPGPHFNSPGHPNGSSAVDPGFSVLFGWNNNSHARVTLSRQQTAWYDFWGLVGVDKQTEIAQSAGGNSLPVAAFDPVQRKLVVQGGLSAKGFGYYDPSINDWVKTISTSGTCPNTFSQTATMTYRTVDSKLWYYNIDGLFTFELATATCAPISVSTCVDENDDPITCPTARTGAGFAYVPEEDKILMAGGSHETQVYYNDTWLLDPTVPSWKRLATTGFPAVSGGPAAGNGNFGRMVYFPKHQVAVAFGTDNSSQTANPIYLFRLRLGSNAGWQYSSSLYPAPSTGLTRTGTGARWTNRTSVAVNGSDVYVASIQSGGTSDTTTGNRQFMPYADSVISGSTVNLGSTYSSIDSINSGNGAEGDWPSVAYINGAPWICWSSAALGDQSAFRLNLKTWNGSAWTGGGRMSTVLNDKAQGKCSLIDISGVPYFAFVEGDGSFNANAFVFQWTGSAFAQIGTGALNVTASTFADSIALTSNGTNPVVAWSEFDYTDTSANIPQVYAKQWSGSAWQGMCGGAAANVQTSRRASHVSATWMGSVLYVAFIEKLIEDGTPNGGHSLLYVRSCNGIGGTWTTVGSGDLNRDQYNGNVYSVSITNDGTDLFLTWVETGNNANDSVGPAWSTNTGWYFRIAQKPAVFASKLTTGGTLTKLGGSLNNDTAFGSATSSTIAMRNGNPIVAFVEHKFGSLRQFYLKGWNGEFWSTDLDSVPPELPASVSRVSSGSRSTSGSVQ